MTNLTYFKQPNLLNSFLGQLEAAEGSQFHPSVDIQETEKGYQFSADLPGLDRKNIDIEVKDHFLVIAGERTQDTVAGEGRYSHFERRYGKFRRAFQLPQTADLDKVSAEYKNGVLNVFVEKKEIVKPKKIEVLD